jgi:hypothetical protein
MRSKRSYAAVASGSSRKPLYATGYCSSSHDRPAGVTMNMPLAAIARPAEAASSSAAVTSPASRPRMSATASAEPAFLTANPCSASSSMPGP